jgi:alkyldihydroxyacetonephosphate synthase
MPSEIDQSKGSKTESGKSKILQRLRSAIGSENVSIQEVDKVAYSRDYWPITFRWLLEGKIFTLPDFVCWPSSTKEVSDIVKIANEEKVPITPFGEGSGVLGGAIPIDGGIIVDLKRMNKISEINDQNLTVTAQAGINLTNLETELNRKEYTMGHFPQSFYCSSLGGNLSTRAAGEFSTKYGKIDDMVISLEAVLPQGEIIKSKNTPKSSTGPAVERLLLGGEGTLGIITEATLKIWPKPEKTVLKSYSFENMQDGLDVIRNILRKGVFPAVIRLYDALETERQFYQFSQAKNRCMLILLMQGSEELVELEQNVTENLCKEHANDCGEEPARHWLEIRFNVKEAADFAPKDVIFDTIEVSATWDKSMNLYNSMISAVKKINGVFYASAHASHFYPQGVCFYFTFAGVPVKTKPEDFYRKVWGVAMKATLDAGGSISHHHGIGIMRANWLSAELGESLEVLKKIKHALDPEDIMNPKKMGLQIGKN